MLASLHIRNWLLIESVDLELDDGFCVLTGETGAGKSILIDAVKFLLGDKASADFLLSEEQRAEVTAVFDCSQLPSALEALRAWELPFEDDECVIRRFVTANGRSRAFVNDTPVTVATLKDLGNHLLEIHGQHAQHALLNRRRQRHVLDEMLSNAAPLAKVRELAAHASQLVEERHQLSEQSSSEDRVEFLNYQLSELEALGYTAGEMDALEREHRRLAHASELITESQSVQDALTGADDAGLPSALDHAIARLGDLARLDEGFKSVGDLLVNARVCIDEAVTELRSLTGGIDLDPGRLSTLDDRLGAVHAMARKHRIQAEELTSKLESIRDEISSLMHRDERIAEIDAELERVLTQYIAASEKLTVLRRKAGTALGKDVSRYLGELGLKQAKFGVLLEPLQPPTLHAPETPALGLDRIEFVIATIPGKSPGPLNAIASGGELSRVGLAVHLAAKQSHDGQTMIFDEVDVGIGGGVAEMVGQRLRSLGVQAQVLCVTHLAQIASQAATHLTVEKSVKAKQVRTGIHDVRGDARIKEIARMLGGLEITEQTIAHAKEMLNAEYA